ncbi:MAG TPA: GAF domain-containing sensor histidine kinase [Chloroflexota bacterium]|nr:GAF domain-containing sensor histidine kinase [Chloroflexota bacterium]
MAQVFAFNDDLVSAQMRHALEQLRTISDISRAINSSLRSRDVLAQIVSSAVELLDAQLSWLGEFEGDSMRYQFSAGYTVGGKPGIGEELGPEFSGWFELGQGPIATPLRNGQAVQLNDIGTALAGAPTPPFAGRGWSMRATLQKRGIRSVLVVPMLRHDRLLGFLGVGSAQPRTFSPQEISVLTTLADHSISAIENARLYQAEHDRELEAFKVLEVTRAVSSSLVLDDVLEEAANGIANTVGIPNCALYLYEHEEGLMTGRHAVGRLPGRLPLEAFRELRLHVAEDPFLHELVEKRRPIAVFDVARDARCDPKKVSVAGSKSVLGVPLVARGELLGTAVLATFKRNYDFKPPQVTLAMSLAHSVALAIENALLHERSQAATLAEERNRLAREIHDTLAQGFTGIILQLEGAEQVLALESYADRELSAALEHIDKARSLARNSLQEARRSLWNLLPGPLERDTLDGAIFQAVKELGAESDMEGSFSCTGEPHELSHEAQTCLLRVTQEALANVRKHSHARHVDVALAYEDAGVSLTIRDDGQGFDPAAPRPAGRSGGFGLIGMRERCQLANGVFTVESAPGQGTVIHVFLWARSPSPAGRGQGRG